MGLAGLGKAREVLIALRLDNTGEYVVEVYPSLLCNQMTDNVEL